MTTSKERFTTKDVSFQTPFTETLEVTCSCGNTCDVSYFVGFERKATRLRLEDTTKVPITTLIRDAQCVWYKSNSKDPEHVVLSRGDLQQILGDPYSFDSGAKYNKLMGMKVIISESLGDSNPVVF